MKNFSKLNLIFHQLIKDNYGKIAKLPADIIKSMGKRKIFCIGHNKTGTTSLTVALRELGFIVAPQKPAEMLLKEWAHRDFRRLSLLCHTGQAFQDVPFSLPYTYQAMDLKFPGSKFILTIRDNEEQWYNSLVKFHSSFLGKTGNSPTIDQIRKSKYCYPGWMEEYFKYVYSTPEDDIYNKKILIDHYNSYNSSILQYFQHRKRDLLVLNVAQKDSYKMLCAFLKVKPLRTSFPWENKTKNSNFS